MRGWTVRDCMELYSVPAWGAGFFSVNAKGHVEVQPHPNGPGIDLLDLVQDLQQRGVRTPLLMRFSDILAARVQGLCGAFERAIKEYGYQGALPRRLPDQGQPAAPRRRGDRRVRRRPASASRPAASPSC